MIVATWVDARNNIKFNSYYKTRSAFLRAYARSSKAILNHAVDDKKVFIIRPSNIEEYRRMK